MQRGSLADLTTFIAVADSLSFRVAASQLGVTASALSHSMRQLEERIGTRLLNRTTRSVSLTDAGVRLLERLRPAVDQITDALEDLNQERGRPVGRLRIYVTNMAAMAVIAPIWKRYLSTYPEVNLEVEVGEPTIDIVAKGFDAGIGPQNRTAIDMIAVRVTGPIKIAMVGAPSYFAQRKPPRTPDEVSCHSCVQYRRGPDGLIFDWIFERNGKSKGISVNGRVIVNTPNWHCARRWMGWGSHMQSKLRRILLCVQGSWSACWKSGHQQSKDCSCIIRATGACPRRCVRSLT